MKNLIFILILVILTSCSMKETLVSNADTLIYHKTLSKLDLDPKQKVALKEDIKKYLNAQKSKTEEANRLIKSIDLSKIEELAPTYRGLSEFYREIAIAYSGVISKYMGEFDSKQQEALFKVMDKDNKELEDKIKENDIEEYYKRYKFFFGTINDSQKKVVASYSDYFREQSRVRLNAKKQLLVEFKKIYTDSIPQHEKAKRLHDAFKKYNGSLFPNPEKTIEIIQKIVVECDSKQITYFNEKKEELLEIITLFAKSKY